MKKALDTEKKQMTDAVGSTVKKRRDDINSSYDAEINKAQDQLKKARAKREKAKNQGMKERIAEETSELHEYNKELPVSYTHLEYGYIILEHTEYPMMSGGNTIAVATVLLETGMIKMKEPYTDFNLETDVYKRQPL